MLLINRVICLTELGRAAEALPDVARLRAVPADASGRGTLAAGFKTLAIAALSAGETALGRELVESARRAEREDIPDERLERAIAAALLARADGDLHGAVTELEAVRDAATAGLSGLSLRVRCGVHQALSQVHEARGDAAAALQALRAWQGLAQEKARLASRAHAQAAVLRTELLLLQHRLDEKDAQRRATQRAHAELEVINAELSRKVEQVQALQTALQE